MDVTLRPGFQDMQVLKLLICHASVTEMVPGNVNPARAIQQFVKHFADQLKADEKIILLPE